MFDPVILYGHNPPPHTHDCVFWLSFKQIVRKKKQDRWTMSKISGTVKWFSNRKGFGFINPSSDNSPTQEAIFVHQTSIYSDGDYRTLVSWNLFGFVTENYLDYVVKYQFYFHSGIPYDVIWNTFLFHFKENLNTWWHLTKSCCLSRIFHCLDRRSSCRIRNWNRSEWKTQGDQRHVTRGIIHQASKKRTKACTT